MSGPKFLTPEGEGKPGVLYAGLYTYVEGKGWLTTLVSVENGSILPKIEKALAAIQQGLREAGVGPNELLP